jgi:Na+-transporting NADH:ubiquinone oxidoreductase subunit A
MPEHFRTKKGLDIPIGGRPTTEIGIEKPARSVGLLGRDYVGLKPQILIQAGDTVSLGDPLFIDKRDPKVKYVAPGSGTVSSVNRGARRSLLSIVIDLDESESNDPAFPELAEAQDFTDDELRSALFDSGLWTAFRTRPYSKVPQSDSTPRSVFVTAIDSHPLAADPSIVVQGSENEFEFGLKIISRLTDGPLHLCTDTQWKGPTGDANAITHSRFSGPHPSGLPGTHIHLLDPASADRTVWHINYQDVIAIGILFTQGRLSVERTIALSGPGIAKPRLVKSQVGACTDELVAGELVADQGLTRVISGAVLSGRRATGAEAFLGRYHLQVTAIADSVDSRLMGWLGPVANAYTFTGLFKRRKRRSGHLAISTNSHGRNTAMIPTEAFDKLIPMDILPVPLLRALLIGDTDQAQALGCLELDPEDLALCSFVCPGKNNYGSLLRVNLDRIEREG